MIAAILASVLLLAALSLGASAVVEHFRRWPDPDPSLRPFACCRCRCRFRDDRMLAMHVRQQHEDSYVRYAGPKGAL